MFIETQWIDSPAKLTQKCTNEQENRSEEDIWTEAWRERQKEKGTIEKNVKTCYQGVTNKLLESPKVTERKILGEKKF